MGMRQSGRTEAENVFTCESDTASIVQAAGAAMQWEGQECCSPYGYGDSASRIAGSLFSFIQADKSEILRKSFYLGDILEGRNG